MGTDNYSMNRGGPDPQILAGDKERKGADDLHTGYLLRFPLLHETCLVHCHRVAEDTGDGIAPGCRRKEGRVGQRGRREVVGGGGPGTVGRGQCIEPHGCEEECQEAGQERRGKRQEGIHRRVGDGDDDDDLDSGESRRTGTW